MSASDGAIDHAAGRSQLREWRRLFVVLVLMLSPLLVTAALEGLAWRIGETMPMSLISKWQDGAPDRLWRGGDGHSYLTYKLARVADLKPEILALGPSRANSFRAAAFAPYTFFNAGLTAWTFEQYRRFLELSPATATRRKSWCSTWIIGCSALASIITGSTGLTSSHRPMPPTC
jgi:hypothetical protein